jgi:hypothetical protein
MTRIVISLTVLIAALMICIRIGEWRTRHRTEKLIAEMYGLRVGQTTSQDAQSLFNRWNGMRRDYGPSCVANGCSYLFVIDDPSAQLLHKVCPGSFQCIDDMLWLAGVLHANLPSARLELEFENGVLAEASVAVTTAVPKGAGPTSDAKDVTPYSSGSYELIGNSIQRRGDRFSPFGAGFEGHFTVIKPNCMNCMALDGNYTPEATRDEIEPLLAFNLSCMTQWKPCTVEKDIAPALWALYSSQETRASTPQR